MNKELYSIFFINNSFYKFKNASRAILYYRNYSINLLSGRKENFGIESYFNNTRSVKALEKVEQIHIHHLLYELGHIFMDQENFLKEDTPLAIEVVYKESDKISKSQFKKTKIDLREKLIPKESDYKRKFERVQDNLNKGNCYQINLTDSFSYNVSNVEIEGLISNFFKDVSNLGNYAHISNIPLLKKTILSNSPETLFSLRPNGILSTRPIKGTEKIRKGEKFIDAWKRLTLSKKNQAELYMITDLLRNDLSKIERPISIVKKLKSPLQVPGLAHQYSLIETHISNKTSLYKILYSLFPGGSITGAPKKNVMKLIKEIENRDRGIYCGSTILMYEDIKCASINIRTAEYCSENELLRYDSGGGITTLSRPTDEYTEMIAKKESFIHLLS